MPAEPLAPPPDEDQEETAEADNAVSSAILDAIVKLNQSVAPPVGEAELATYNLIMDDKPIKFAGAQVGFRRAEEEKHDKPCSTCWHYAQFPAKARKKEQRGACEIMRPDDGDESVEAGDTCDWHNTDGTPPSEQTAPETTPESSPSRSASNLSNRQR